jgi:hypothetical protein
MRIILGSIFPNGDMTALKCAVLFCDEVLIVDCKTALMAPLTEPNEKGELIMRADGRWDLAPASVRSRARSAVKEGIVRFVRDPTTDEDWPPLTELCLDILPSFFDIDQHGRGVPKPHFAEIGSFLTGRASIIKFQSLDKGYYSPSSMISHVYGFAAGTWLAAARQNQVPIITDSPVIEELLRTFARADQLDVRYRVAEHRIASLAEEVLRLRLPHLSDAPFDEILEVRATQRDELVALRTALRRFSAHVEGEPWSQELIRSLEKVSATEIVPAIDELQRSLRASSSSSVRRVFQRLRDPAAYLPLVGMSLAGVDLQIATLAGIGVECFRQLYETLSERRTVKEANGLAFLLQSGPTQKSTRRAGHTS